MSDTSDPAAQAGQPTPQAMRATIVGLADVLDPLQPAPPVQPAGLTVGAALPSAAPGSPVEVGADLLSRAQAFVQPLLSEQRLDTGENAWSHAAGVHAILLSIGAAPSLCAAAYLVYASAYLTQPQDILEPLFGADAVAVVMHTVKLVHLQRGAQDAWSEEADGPLDAQQVERVRKMLLAFSKDLRVVLLRLASRLQTLRHYASSKQVCPRGMARQSLQVFAPLANRLGIGQIKWEMEDLAFRFLMPQAYHEIAKSLDEKRAQREADVEQVRLRVSQALRASGVEAQVQGRPKHLYSIWKKMQGKGLDLSRMFDLRAIRVIVQDVPACYAALSCLHALWQPLSEEFADYIAKPKGNGYQSLHTVLQDERGRSVEVQIRTLAMHEHAEHGVAAHWAYKEAGARGYAGVQSVGDFQARLAQARKSVLQQLLAWERDVAALDAQSHGAGARGWFDDRIYVFTPAGTIVDLPAGSTAVDFAYAVHTDLGHRCRGAKVDGSIVPLQTPLKSGESVEVISAKEGGPSLDWLNPELGYLQSARAKSKVRAWFNAVAQRETIAKGRDAVEKLLQREGKTAVKLDDLASQMGFKGAEALFEAVGKDEYSLKPIEQHLRGLGKDAATQAREPVVPRLARDDSDRSRAAHSGVLVVGVDDLMTQLARCCKPAPPDPIGGYVTRGKGVAVHRTSCSNFKQMTNVHPERVIAVAWGEQAQVGGAPFAIDITLCGHDRPGLMRDVFDALAPSRTGVSAMRSRSDQDRLVVEMTWQVSEPAKLPLLLGRVEKIAGVTKIRRK